MRSLLACACASIIVSCTQPTPCAAMGGQCTRVDSECRTTEEFVGFDPACEPNSRCCVPKSPVDSGLGGGTADAGTCAAGDVCWNKTAACPSGTAAAMGSCAGVCCAQADTFCGAIPDFIGHCIAKGTMCAAGEKEIDGIINGTTCPSTEVCCAVQ